MATFQNKTENEAVELQAELNTMRTNMRLFTRSLRSLYAKNAFGRNAAAARKIRQLHDDIRNDAMVYLKGVLPLSTKFVTSTSEHFEFCETVTSFEEWCEIRSDFLEKTICYRKQCQTLLKIHEDIWLLLERGVYESGALIPALDDFINGIRTATAFFAQMEEDFCRVENKAEVQPRRIHYNVIKIEAKKLKSFLEVFYKVLRDVRVELLSIPTENVDWCYVEEWLLKHTDTTKLKMVDNETSETNALVVMVREQIESMAISVKSFPASVRSLQKESVSIKTEAGNKYRKLRDDTVNDALVFLNDALPLSIEFVESLGKYFECYEALEFDEWRQDIPRILAMTISYRERSQALLQKHEDSLVQLKRKHGQAEPVRRELGELKTQFEMKKRELEKAASRKRGWAIFLAFIPIVNLIATPALLYFAHSDSKKADAENAQAAKHKAAAIEVKKNLIPAIESFIGGISETARFFSTLEQELCKFEGKAVKSQQKQMFLHYKTMKKEAKDIKPSCQAFNSVLSGVITDLRSYPELMP